MNQPNPLLPVPAGFHREHRGDGWLAEGNGVLVIVRPGPPAYVRHYTGNGGTPTDYPCDDHVAATDLARKLLSPEA